MEEKFLQIDENKIRYLESGNSKKTLVLVHGLGASAERWNPVIPIFAENYHVLVPDLIGFGYSDKPLVDYTPDFFSDFLKKFFTATKTERASVVGSSLGGQVSAEFTISHPQDVEKLILTSPAGVMEHSTPALDAYIMAALYPNELNAKKAFELMEGSGEEVPEEIVSGFVERMKLPNAKLAFMSTILGLKNSKLVSSKLESIITPTLVIWGVDDPVIPIENSEIFISKIQGCQLFKMEHCGHTPYVQDPHTFSSKVLEFLTDP
ncbi:alpha/beta fold hydrolase [Nitrosopumilus ureiphilus]|uniref:Alpha/beta hydrolase n=1 Tax=Nitrosopumilus ureiphilus TaxID=1470067 RepID=A0A7D5M4J7_9ARCH|nr:alpha/beta hydrolase [Nitrosopumilus ureiphilus]QLH06986.1 alpha/beta hydrolase [Nitrosopumilus ureiphilus]